MNTVDYKQTVPPVDNGHECLARCDTPLKHLANARSVAKELIHTAIQPYMHLYVFSDAPFLCACSVLCALRSGEVPGALEPLSTALSLMIVRR